MKLKLESNLFISHKGMGEIKQKSVLALGSEPRPHMCSTLNAAQITGWKTFMDCCDWSILVFLSQFKHHRKGDQMSLLKKSWFNG